ncbi:MAG: hypothetical protein ABI616_15825 [Pseudomonadota bacterium]
MKSSAPAPSAGRDALAASVDLGYRFTPQWGLGFEYGGLIPVDGCADWPCGDTPAAFAPRFTRLMVFSEFRPRDSGWRFRAGVGASRFCQSRHWSATAWSIGDTLGLLLTAALDDDLADETVSGSGSWRCDAHMKALGGMVSVGYDWPIAREHPVSLGLRLSAEAADFGPTRAIGLPAFQHRALMLSLHVSIN